MIMDDRAVFLWLYLGGGMFFVAIALPLLWRKIPPNDWYGFRVQTTLENPQIWYDANAYMAQRLLIVGGLTAGAAVIGYYLPGLELVPYFVLCTVVMMVGLIINLAQGFNYLKKFSK
jgi:hypothetical protein